MCELLGLSFNRKVTAEISFKALKERGKDQPDGWGFAYYEGKASVIFKEPISAHESELAKFLTNYDRLSSKIFISHIRFSSRGSMVLANTHPFKRVLNGKEYVFAHNGTLNDYEDLGLDVFKPVGETDSEHCFCYLLDKIAERNLCGWSSDDFKWLNDLFHRVNEYGKLNCLMSDGEYLFAYHNNTSSETQLYYLERKAPYGNIRLKGALKDEDMEINLGELKGPDQYGYVIATDPLTREDWVPFDPGQLIVFNSGELIYS